MKLWTAAEEKELAIAERVQRTQRQWQAAEPRLLVFDNCDGHGRQAAWRLLDEWRPVGGGARVLVTSLSLIHI